MKRTMQMTLAAALALAIGGFEATTAQAAAEGPYYTAEAGRLESGETQDVKATAKTKFVLENSGLKVSCGKLKFQKGATIVGSTGANAGESKETLEYSECTVTGNGSPCEVEGGAVTTKALVGTLGYSNESRSGPVLELFAPTGKELGEVKFKGSGCTTKSAAITGTVVGEILAGGKAVEIGKEGEGETGEVRLPKTAKTIFVEASGKLTSKKAELTLGGKSATLEGTTIEELNGVERWGVSGQVGKVWTVEGTKLFEMAMPKKSLSGTASLSLFELRTTIAGIKITCASVTPLNGSIKNRVELDTVLVFGGCLVTAPANCEVREAGTVGQITFKLLEGKLNDDILRFRESSVSVPVAAFELINAGANNCAEKGNFKLTGRPLVAFTGLMRNPEASELEKKFSLEASAGGVNTTLFLTKEGVGGFQEMNVSGEIGFKLNPNENWATVPA